MKLILPFLLLATVAMGQTKIGNITISDSVAQKYFLNCYNFPDTVAIDRPDCNGCSWSNEEMKSANEHQHEIGLLSIGKAYRSVYHKAGIDTLWDVENLTNGTHSKAYSKIVNFPAETTQEFIGYLVPRKPSEIDFIKWQHKIFVLKVGTTDTLK